MNRVRMKHSGVGDLLKSREVADQLRPLAEKVLAQARATAPVDSGAYRDSLHIEEYVTDRASARVVASVPYAMVVEANTGNLARALDAAR